MNNILHIRASNFYGGPEKQLHYHARLAAQKGFRVCVSSFSEENKSPEFLDVIAADNLPTHLFEVTSAYDQTAVDKIHDFICGNEIDIVCSHDYRTHHYARLARKNSKAKWIAFSRGWTKDDLKVRLYNCFDKLQIRLADHIVAVSEAQKKKLEKVFIAADKISVVHNAIDPEIYQNLQPTDLKRKFNWPDDALVVVTAGRFTREKGQLMMIKAARKALDKNEKLRFIMFGEGADYNQAVDIIKKNQLENKIICPGFEKNISAALKGSDIIVNPSYSEGLPNIVLEAMALKVPVIATSVGGVPEIITDNFNGRLAQAGDYNQLAQLITATVEDTENRRKMADNGYDTIIDKFAFDAQTNKLINLYKDILGVE